MAAERRLHMTSKCSNFIVEGHVDHIGEMKLKAIRKHDLRFKRCRIKKVLQWLPDMVPVYEVVETT